MQLVQLPGSVHLICNHGLFREFPFHGHGLYTWALKDKNQ